MIVFHKKYQRKKKIKKILATSFLILVILGGGLYAIFFSPLFKVKEINILGNEKVKDENIRKIIEEKIFRKLIFFSPKNIFWLDLETPKEEILESYPQIATVYFRKKFPSKLILEIKERKKVAIFYLKEMPFFIDKEGVIFEEVKELNSEFVIRSEKTGFVLGDSVIEKENLENILKVQKALSLLEIEVEDFLLFSPKRLNIKTIEGWQIYFDLFEDLDWQITKLKLALEKKIPPEKRGDLEYIDVRFGNMVYPKYRY